MLEIWSSLTDSECKTFFYKSNLISFSQLSSHYSKNIYYIEIGLESDVTLKHLLCLLYRQFHITISDDHK